MTAQQIADEIRAGEKILAEIVAGLDGVTGGRWCQFHPDYCHEAKGTTLASSWDTSHDLSTIVDGSRKRLATFKHAADAAHVDRCSPDALRSIAAAMQAFRSDNEQLRYGLWALEANAEADAAAMQAKDARIAEVENLAMVMEAEANQMREVSITNRHRAEAAEAALAAMTAEREALLDANRALPYDRDALGRFVREAWVRWAETQPDPKPSWLVPYDDLPEADKEADRQIGEAVARWTLIGDAAARAFLAKHKEGGENG